jgi:hypothetical protein
MARKSGTKNKTEKTKKVPVTFYIEEHLVKEIEKEAEQTGMIDRSKQLNFILKKRYSEKDKTGN